MYKKILIIPFLFSPILLSSCINMPKENIWIKPLFIEEDKNINNKKENKEEIKNHIIKIKTWNISDKIWTWEILKEKKVWTWEKISQNNISKITQTWEILNSSWLVLKWENEIISENISDKNWTWETNTWEIISNENLKNSTWSTETWSNN